MVFKGTIIINKEDNLFVATCVENNIASQGKTIDEATENIKEAISLYYEDEEEKNSALLRNEPVYITTLEMAI